MSFTFYTHYCQVSTFREPNTSVEIFNLPLRKFDIYTWIVTAVHSLCESIFCTTKLPYIYWYYQIAF